MQLALPMVEQRQILEQLDGRLRARFGRPAPHLQFDPVSQLVLGMVGGRTYEADSRRAFETLIHRFRRWENVRDGRLGDIRDAIQAVTYAEAKAGRLKAALRTITAARGRLTLDFLQSWTVEEALLWLECLPGVGRKTAAATLNFSTLRMKALVIDTHHLRVLRRLGLVGPRVVLPNAYDRIVPHLPAAWTADDFDDHHELMKRLGQTICHHGDPACRDCPLSDLCPSAIGGRDLRSSAHTSPLGSVSRLR